MGHEPHQRSDSGQNDDGRYPASTVASELHSSFRLLSGLVVSGLVVDNWFVSSWRGPAPPVIADVQVDDIILRAKVVIGTGGSMESSRRVSLRGRYLTGDVRTPTMRQSAESPRCPHPVPVRRSAVVTVCRRSGNR